MQTEPRQCGLGAACGRPFLVDGSPRRASVESREDWAFAPCAPELQALDAAACAVLAAHWTDLGSMEHASVAAFARFVLELMAAGAPSELVASAQEALGDEIEHARLCFGLASAYAGEPLGPGTLSAQGVLDDLSFRGYVVRAIHEACVGETLAAVEALEALTSASDPAVSCSERSTSRSPHHCRKRPKKSPLAPRSSSTASAPRLVGTMPGARRCNRS